MSPAEIGEEARRRGNAGEALFKNYLGRQKWIANKASDDDRGTDLIVFLDATNRGQFATLGFQVKTPDRIEFKNTRDKRYGYTYRESKKEAAKHFPYWVNHDVPHLLIVQTEDESIRLWQYLDRRHVQKTSGGGLKVFIPATQIVGVKPPQEWLTLASRRATQRFEAITRWEAGQGGQIPPEDQVRFALLVPRLVAAHPNQGARGFTAAQAIADVAMDGDKWARVSGRSEDVPGLAQALDHPDEVWRLAGAFRKNREDGDESLLKPLADGAQSPTVRAGARALAAAVLLEDARPHEALERAVPDDDFSPEDKHWLAALRVSALRALGDREGLLAQVTEALAGTPLLASDPTVRQLNAALVWANFVNQPEEQRDFAAVANAADHAASWWRDGHFSRAFEASTRRLFRAWSNEQSLVFGGDYVGHNQLAAVSLQVRIGGVPAEARRAMSILGRVDAMTFEGDAAILGAALNTLVLSGDEKSLVGALRRCLRNAPVKALAGLVATAIRAAKDLDLVKSSLEALRLLGPYLADAEVGAVKETLIGAVLAADQPYREQAIGSATADLALRALKAIHGSLEIDEVQTIVTWIKARRPNDAFDDNALDSATRLLDERGCELPSTDRREILQLLEGADSASAQYWALVSALGKTTNEGNALLLKGLDEGVERAQQLARQVDAFRPEHQQAMLQDALDHLARERDAAPKPGVTMRARDHARLALQFARALHDVDAGRAVVEYLADPDIKPDYKRGAALILAGCLEEFPGIDPAAFEAAAVVMREQRGTQQLPFAFPDADLGGAPESVLLRLPTVEPALADECVTTLLLGNDQGRRDLAVALAYKDGYDVPLAALTQDTAYAVKSAAAAAVAYALVTRRPNSPVLMQTLTHTLESSGPEVHRQVRRAVENATGDTPEGMARKLEVLGLVHDRLESTP